MISPGLRQMLLTTRIIAGIAAAHDLGKLSALLSTPANLFQSTLNV
jgi:hypothetical protein